MDLKSCALYYGYIKCENKLLFLVDKGSWYLDAFKSLGLEYRHETFSMRNRIERWFDILKAKLKTFYNRFPANATIKSIKDSSNPL